LTNHFEEDTLTADAAFAANHRLGGTFRQQQVLDKEVHLMSETMKKDHPMEAKRA
jgi:hypothetical protein